MAHASTIQEMTMYTAHCDWVVRGTGLTGSPTEYSIQWQRGALSPLGTLPPPIQHAPPPSDLQEDIEVWSSDGLQMDQLTGKWEGRMQPSDGTSKTQETERSAQLAELQVAVLAAAWGAGTIYTDSCAVRAGATQWLPYWKAEGWKTEESEVRGKELGGKLYLIAQAKKNDGNLLRIGHVSTHMKGTDLGARRNHEADCFAYEPRKSNDTDLPRNIYTPSTSDHMMLGWLHDSLELMGGLDLARQVGLRGWPISKAQCQDFVASCPFVHRPEPNFQLGNSGPTGEMANRFQRTPTTTSK